MGHISVENGQAKRSLTSCSMEKLLVIGGTNFIGRNLLEKLIELDRYELTLFNRGETNPHLFPQISKIRGDRYSNDIDQIGKQDWDYVIDLSCYYPKSLERILKNLNTKLKRYIFISTCSVYDNDMNTSVLRDEDAPILPCSPEQREDMSTASYGHRKAECERILEQSDVNHIILRPSLVYGRYDNTDRLYYWLYQVKQTDELIVPNHGESVFSITYVHDLVNAIINGIVETPNNETFNVTTLPTCSIKQLIDCSADLLKKQPIRRNASSEFLKANDVNQWMDLPLWLDCDYYTYDNSRITNGMDIRFTNVNESISQTINHYHNLGWPEPMFGMPETRKSELIKRLITG